MLSAVAGFINRYFVRFPSLPVHQVRQLVWGNGVVQLVSLLSYPLLLLWYSPEQMGEFGVVSSMLVIGGSLAALRYDRAIVIGQTDEEVNALFWLGALLSIFSSLLFGGILYIISLQQLITLPEVAFTFVPWLLPAIGGFSLFLLLQNWLTRLEAYKSISVLRVGQKLLVLGIQLAAIIYAWQQNGLIVGLLAGTVLFGLSGLMLIRKQLAWPSFQMLVRVLKRYRDFPLYNATLLVLELPLSRLLYFLLPLFYDLRITGWYTVVALLLVLPEMVIGQGVGQVFYRKLADEPITVHEMLVRKTFRSLQQSALLIFGMYLLLAVGGIYFLKETDWHGMPFVLLLLLPAYFMRFLTAPLSPALQVWRKMQVGIYFTLSGLLVKPVLFWLGYQLGSMYLALAFISGFDILLHAAFLLMLQATLKGFQYAR